MKGMHCPICLEDGPDLTADVRNHGEPYEVEIRFEFTCPTCRRRWRWLARSPDEFPRYKLIERMLTNEDRKEAT